MSKRVVVVFSNGEVDIISDPDASVLFIDAEAIKAGDKLTTDDTEGFEDLIPCWFPVGFIPVK
jgi:hypothetical protein